MTPLTLQDSAGSVHVLASESELLGWVDALGVTTAFVIVSEPDAPETFMQAIKSDSFGVAADPAAFDFEYRDAEGLHNTRTLEREEVRRLAMLWLSDRVALRDAAAWKEIPIVCPPPPTRTVEPVTPPSTHANPQKRIGLPGGHVAEPPLQAD